MADPSQVGLTTTPVRPAGLALGFALVAWLILALALPLAALTLNAFKIGSFPLGFWVAAQGSLIGLTVLAIVATRGPSSGPSMPTSASAALISAEAVGGAAFVGFAGAVAALGFDGLAFPLGVAAGLALLAILIAPRLDSAQASSVVDYFGSRFGGVWPSRLAAIITGVGSVLLVAANLRAGGLAVQGLLATSFTVGIVGTGVTVFAISLLAQRAGPGLTRWLARGAFSVMLIAFLTPLIWLTLRQGRMPIPHIAFGAAIFDVAASEQKLLTSRLADFKSLKPLAAPFLSLSMWNFAGIVLSIALGLAALPWVSRHIRVVGQSGVTAARATALTVLFLSGIAAIAVLLRAAVAGLVATSVKTAELPVAILQSSYLGWVDVCGKQAFSAADVVAACAKVAGQKGVLRLQDLAFDSDSFLFAATWMAGVPPWVWAVLLAVGLFAALISSAAMLRACAFQSNALRDPRPELALGAGLTPLQSTAAGLILAAAISVATLGTADIPTLFSEGLSLIASGIFPALVLGLLWQRTGAAGAVAAMLSGFMMAGLYLAGVRLFPVAMFEWTGALSNAAPSAVRKLADLHAVFIAAADDSARDEARKALFRHAQIVANWWGLKPAAFVLLAAPISLAVGAVATLLAPRSASSR